MQAGNHQCWRGRPTRAHLGKGRESRFYFLLVVFVRRGMSLLRQWCWHLEVRNYDLHQSMSRPMKGGKKEVNLSNKFWKKELTKKATFTHSPCSKLARADFWVRVSLSRVRPVVPFETILNSLMGSARKQASCADSEDLAVDEQLVFVMRLL